MHASGKIVYQSQTVYAPCSHLLTHVSWKDTFHCEQLVQCYYRKTLVSMTDGRCENGTHADTSPITHHQRNTVTYWTRNATLPPDQMKYKQQTNHQEACTGANMYVEEVLGRCSIAGGRPIPPLPSPGSFHLPTSSHPHSITSSVQMWRGI